jgi:hypothetical protein
MAKYSAKLNYEFDASAGTLDFTNQDGFDVRNLFSVVNVSSSNAALYLIGISGFGATISTSGRVLTLAQSTAGMTDDDTLIFVYDAGEDAIAELAASAAGRGIAVTDGQILEMLGRIRAELRVSNILTAHIAGVNDDLAAMADEIVTSNA